MLSKSNVLLPFPYSTCDALVRILMEFVEKSLSAAALNQSTKRCDDRDKFFCIVCEH